MPDPGRTGPAKSDKIEKMPHTNPKGENRRDFFMSKTKKDGFGGQFRFGCILLAGVMGYIAAQNAPSALQQQEEAESAAGGRGTDGFGMPGGKNL